MKIIFAGTPTFAVPCLQALMATGHSIVGVYTQPDRPAGRGQQMHASPIKQLALQQHLPVFQPKSLRDETAQQQLRELNADLMIVVAYGLILPKIVLTTPRLGCINVHASLLPRWRGAAPIQHAILAGDKETGITLMQMDEGLDTGDMLYKLSCPILATDTAQSLHDTLSTLGANALLELLPAIENHNLHAEPQDNALACYASKITKEEAHIQWDKSAVEINRAVQAYNPFPIAYTHLDAQLIKIWEVEAIENSTDIPGKILHADTHGIDVATGEGVLRIKRLQLAGGKPLAVRDILNSRRELFAIGKQFS